MENLDELLQSINDAVWQLQLPAKKFIYVNQRFADICELPLEIIKNDPEAYNELIHPHDKPRVLDGFERALAGIGIETEYRIITPSGIKWIRHKERLVCDSKGKYEVLVGIFSDITQRVSNDHQILMQNTRLREIAALASHDVRGHVASILGLIDLIDKRDLSNPTNVELLDYLEEASQKLDAVIHKIIDKSYDVEKDPIKIPVLQSQLGNESL